jgi:hypothetical protein
MTRGKARGWGAEDGQALVEFALVVPVLLLLLVGLVEFSRAWNTQQVLTDTAREALRNSVVANPGYTYQSMQSQIDLAEVTVEGFKSGTGTPARIRIDYRYELVFFGPLVEWAAGDRTLALSTSFVMRNE